MMDTSLTDQQKFEKTNTMRKSEVNFLRFLRTSERPQNYSTLRIIGKGAFGEVKLVQRKHDGKIYALKSLVKAEMVIEPCAYGRTTLMPKIVQERSACTRSRRTRHSRQCRQPVAGKAAYLISGFDLSIHAHGVPPWWRSHDYAHQIHHLLRRHNPLLHRRAHTGHRGRPQAWFYSSVRLFGQHLLPLSFVLTRTVISSPTTSCWTVAVISN